MAKAKKKSAVTVIKELRAELKGANETNAELRGEACEARQREHVLTCQVAHLKEEVENLKERVVDEKTEAARQRGVAQGMDGVICRVITPIISAATEKIRAVAQK